MQRCLFVERHADFCMDDTVVDLHWTGCLGLAVDRYWACAVQVTRDENVSMVQNGQQRLAKEFKILGLERC